MSSTTGSPPLCSGPTLLEMTRHLAVLLKNNAFFTLVFEVVVTQKSTGLDQSIYPPVIGPSMSQDWIERCKTQVLLPPLTHQHGTSEQHGKIEESRRSHRSENTAQRALDSGYCPHSCAIPSLALTERQCHRPQVQL